MLNNKIKIIDVTNKEKFLLLSEFIEENSVDIKNKYLDVITSLDNKKFGDKNLKEHFSFKDDYNLWEMSSIIEKSTIKNNNILNVLKYFALKTILNDQTTKTLILYNFDKNFYNIFKPIKAIKFYKKQKNLFSLNYNFFKKTNLFIFFSYLIFLLRNFFKLNFKKKILKENSIFFLSYYAHLNSKEYHYDSWGKLYSKLKENNNFLHFFVSSRKKNFFLNYNKNSFFVNDYFKFSFVLKIISNYLFYKKKFSEIRRYLFEDCDDLELNHVCIILKNDFEESLGGKILLENLTWIFLFENLFKSIPYQRKGVYIYENQPWERAFIKSWKKYKHGKLYGFVTASVHFWLLNYFDTNPDLISRPDNVLCSSKHTKLFLKENNFKNDQIFIVEGYKYNKIYKKKIINNKKETLVFFGDYFRPINNNLLTIISNVSKIKEVQSRFEIYYKPHPENTLLKLSKNIKILDNKLDFEYSLVCCPNTSIISAEFLSNGIKTLIYKDINFLDMSPFKNLDIINYKNIYFSNDVELLHILNKEKEIYLKNNKIDYFYYNDNYKSWLSVLN